MLPGHAEMTVKNELCNLSGPTIHTRPGLTPNTRALVNHLKGHLTSVFNTCKIDLTSRCHMCIFVFTVTFKVKAKLDVHTRTHTLSLLHALCEGLIFI